MNENLKDKKIILLIIGFVISLIVISTVYLVVNRSNNDYSYNNPSGAGGDYTPPNSVAITNGGILYKYLITSDVEKTFDIIDSAVLYNLAFSNNPKAPSDYRQFSSLDEDIPPFYKDGVSYVVTIDDGKIHFNEKTPRDYWITLTTDDNRHFRLDSVGSKVENKNGAQISIKPIKD